MTFINNFPFKVAEWTDKYETCYIMLQDAKVLRVGVVNGSGRGQA